jgi:hypothetical protein
MNLQDKFLKSLKNNKKMNKLRLINKILQKLRLRFINKELIIKIFQGLVVGFFYTIFLISGALYAGLGMSPKYYQVVIFIISIPQNLLSFFCCNHLYNLAQLSLINLFFSWIISSTILIAFKINTETWRVILKSIKIGILLIFFIDIIVHPYLAAYLTFFIVLFLLVILPKLVIIIKSKQK